MNILKIITISIIGSATFANAQDIDTAKKTIDAEQFEKAKSMLKSIIAAKPNNGEATFLLGNIYLSQNYVDSAKVVYQKGLTTKEMAHYNNIGLGQIELDNNNVAGAKASFDLATKNIKKKDLQEFVYIARAYIASDKPDYKSAIAILERAKEINYQDPQVLLALGDAYFGDKNQSDAYKAYRDAFTNDASLIRAKMKLGVLLKGAREFTGATEALNAVVATSPDYGPVYRELAETYYLWGNKEASKYKEYNEKALGYYEKYMTLTDYSLTSRMRHADFLILAKDYVALEKEAAEMQKIGGVNPRILRYLGYASYQNGNTDVAIKSLEDYIANPATKKIARDYFVLGQAKMKLATGTDGKIADKIKFDNAVADIKNAVEQEPKIAEEINEIGALLFKQKSYDQAATVFEIATSNKDSKNIDDDNVYYGYSIYYGYNKTKPNISALDKADIAFSEVIAKYPATPSYSYFKAKINNLLEKDDVMAKSYQDFVDKVTAKGPDEITKNKTKIIEAYNNMGAFYANTDKFKAKELWNKTLLIDPTNAYALESLKTVK
ncbi:MAG: tetratricopeptide repeat protein [Flavobacterium sp.]|nr:tetratricopeptide repeat protein [Flavobacterium sp.]